MILFSPVFREKCYPQTGENRDEGREEVRYEERDEVRVVGRNEERFSLRFTFTIYLYGLPSRITWCRLLTLQGHHEILLHGQPAGYQFPQSQKCYGCPQGTGPGNVHGKMGGSS